MPKEQTISIELFSCTMLRSQQVHKRSFPLFLFEFSYHYLNWDEQIYDVHGEVLGLFHSVSAKTSIQKILLVIHLQSFRVMAGQTIM